MPNWTLAVGFNKEILIFKPIFRRHAKISEILILLPEIAHSHWSVN
jgi:hypothetical protein